MQEPGSQWQNKLYLPKHHLKCAQASTQPPTSKANTAGWGSTACICRAGMPGTVASATKGYGGNSHAWGIDERKTVHQPRQTIPGSISVNSTYSNHK